MPWLIRKQRLDDERPLGDTTIPANILGTVCDAVAFTRREMSKSREHKAKEAYERVIGATLDVVPILAGEWLRFCETVHLGDEIPLARRIKIFSKPASEWAGKAYPTLTETTPIPWFVLLFAAVRLAQTHTDAELDAAMETFSRETKMPPLHDLVHQLQNTKLGP